MPSKILCKITIRAWLLKRLGVSRTELFTLIKHDSGSFGPHVHHVPIEEKDGGVEDYLYVEDAVATFDRAIAAGASVVREPEKAGDDDLRGGVEDPWGTTWWIATQQPQS